MPGRSLPGQIQTQDDEEALVGAIGAWLDSVAGTVSAVAVAGFVVIVGAFTAGVLITRDRHFVNRWTKPVIMTGAALILAAIGAPMAGIAVKLSAKGLLALGALPAKLINGK